MSCAPVHRAIREGRAADADVRAHAETCEACAILLEDDGELGRALEGSGGAPGVGADAVLARIDADTGPRATLRRAPAAARAGFVGVVGTCAVVGANLGGLRPDLAVYPVERMVGALVALALSAAVVLWIAMRPLHRPPLPRGVVPAALALALAVPLALALLPDPVGGPPPPHAAALGCFALGSGSGLLVFGLLRALDRRSRAPWWQVALSAGALGLVGNLAVQLHCPATHPEHLLLGHASVGALWVLVTGSWAAATAR
jgi:hypothetical protein